MKDCHLLFLVASPRTRIPTKLCPYHRRSLENACFSFNIDSLLLFWRYHYLNGSKNKCRNDDISSDEALIMKMSSEVESVIVLLVHLASTCRY